MPVIHIQSLPFEQDVDLGELTEKIASDFSETYPHPTNPITDDDVSNLTRYT